MKSSNSLQTTRVSVNEGRKFSLPSLRAAVPHLAGGNPCSSSVLPDTSACTGGQTAPEGHSVSARGLCSAQRSAAPLLHLTTFSTAALLILCSAHGPRCRAGRPAGKHAAGASSRNNAASSLPAHLCAPSRNSCRTKPVPGSWSWGHGRVLSRAESVSTYAVVLRSDACSSASSDT